jgi:hypothetical protein
MCFVHLKGRRISFTALSYSFFRVIVECIRREIEYNWIMPEMGVETQNGGLHCLVLSWTAGAVHVVKDNGSGWLKWLLKQGGVITPHPKHRSKESKSFFISQREKQKQAVPLCLPIPVA